ncbi:MAG: RHS repeat domain-containing protein [Mangrovibacterium sp.]
MPQAASYTSFDQVSTIDEGNYHAAFIYNSENQRAKMEVSQSGNTILTRWYGSSRYMKETAGSTTKEYTWIGGDAYSAPAVAVKEGSTTIWYYLLRDYLGNIIHQVDASGNVVAEYNFDPWGRRRDKDTWSYTLDSEPALFADRGFTGHEHLSWFNLINMNGRLYDPLVGRFLSPDKYVQFPDYTQNFNRYSYCLNNPLIYIDPSGDFFWIFPNISWSKKGGFSLGFSIGFGIPGVASVQVGVGYNLKSGDPYVYGGATFMFNTIYTSYFPSSGWNVGYTAGVSLYSGFPVSTNFATVGVNYNINSGSFSGNLSAWDIDRSGWSFDPSVSAMIFPEQTTNFIRGQGFRTNNVVFNRFVTAENYQGALDYFGFEGEYIGGEGQSYFWFNTNDHSKFGIRYTESAFASYDALFSTYLKESFHMRRFARNGISGLDLGDSEVFAIANMPEERLGVIYQYKNQGLSGYSTNYLGAVGYTENRIRIFNLYQDYNTPYLFTPYKPQWWHFIYKIPRKW